MKRSRAGLQIAVTMAVALMLALPSALRAHCDALDGPLVTEARTALAAGDVTPVLKWVPAGEEAAVRQAFAHAVAVRRLGPEAQELADTYFLETLVRIHRGGEGAPYTGLKPAGGIEPVIQEADRALESGSVDGLADAIARHTADGLRERFTRASEARKHAADSVDAGREYIQAYVSYVHYVEGLAHVVHGGAEHGSGGVHP